MTLSKKQREVLKIMLDNQDTDDGELVYEKGQCYLGCDRVDSRVLFGLIRLCAVSLGQYSTVGEFERYTINETGKELLKGKI